MCNKFLPIYMTIHIWNVFIDVYFSHLLSDSLDSFLNYRHKTSFDIKNDVGLQIFRRFPKAPLIFELEIWDLRNFLGELLGFFSQYPQLQGFSGHHFIWAPGDPQEYLAILGIIWISQINSKKTFQKTFHCAKAALKPYSNTCRALTNCNNNNRYCLLLGDVFTWRCSATLSEKELS